MYRVDLDRELRANAVNHLVETHGLDRDDAEALAPQILNVVHDTLNMAMSRCQNYLGSMTEKPQLRAVSVEKFFEIATAAVSEAFNTHAQKQRLQAEEDDADGT